MESKVSFSTIATEWKSYKKSYVKPTTMAAYSLILEKHLIPFFIDKEHIQGKDLKEFMEAKLESGLSCKSIKDILTVLKMVVNYGMERGYMPQLELHFSSPQPLSIKEMDIFTLEEQRKMIDVLSRERSLKNLGILICLTTGLRIGEICALKWEDIDLAKGKLIVNKTLYRIYQGNIENKKTELLVSTPKTKHSLRAIPLTDWLINTILSIPASRNRNCFILSDSEKPIEPRCYRNYYKNLLARLGLRYLKFHCLRHSFATRCIENDCDYKTLSTILGHADISTTLNLYVHPSFNQKKRCLEILTNKLFGADCKC